ncbi:transcriptional regulator, TetR family [Quadrisphaera granulorum]|uniref:TetR family transcriptional regulator n=1 Tax=Quadrisphaera granulorum TaxID=317664 RepID=A0A315ZRP0_9ACTN|nr:TetR family transcriptional regulator [Quadrisphaera granulorum]PWJ47374.1 TetR family transcriptional regulator [Quadrisphaera granulorum]SZE98821.1 transcriptional regulator, TetR family [Quadrisphaera granulorum]
MSTPAGAAAATELTPVLTRTQLAVLTAYVALIEELGTDDVPFRLIARRSGVAERTVYRTYPTRTQLLVATAAWVEATAFAREATESVFDVPLTVRETMRAYSERPELAHVAAETPLRAVSDAAAGDEALPAETTHVPRLVREELGTADDERQRHLTAALTHLDSPATWVVLRQELQMEPRDIADAAAWAAEVVLRPSPREGGER